MTHTPTFQVAITQFAVKNWPGVSGFTPLLLFTRLSEYAILNYLAPFSNPQKTHLTAFLSWLIQLITHTPKTVVWNFSAKIFNRPNYFNFAHPLRTPRFYRWFA
jgi:hypothetical protein